MIRNLILTLTVAALLLAGATASAAPNWTTLFEDQQALHQADMNAVTVSGEAPDRQLEVWMKSIFKNGSGFMIARYNVQEKGLSFCLRERTIYAASGKASGPAVIYKTDKWSPTTASSPIGAVATRLLAEHDKNPAAFPAPAPEDADQPSAALAAEPQLPPFTPQEVAQALADNRIKHEEKDAARTFHVRDTYTVYYFLSNNRMTADFCLFIPANNAKPTRQLQINLSDTRTGTHSAKPAVTVKIDGREWPLRALSSSPGVCGTGTAAFAYHFNLPDQLIQAIYATKGGITLKWQYMYSGWKDLEYTIPANIVRDIQLMYAGCK